MGISELPSVAGAVTMLILDRVTKSGLGEVESVLEPRNLTQCLNRRTKGPLRTRRVAVHQGAHHCCYIGNSRLLILEPYK